MTDGKIRLSTSNEINVWKCMSITENQSKYRLGDLHCWTVFTALAVSYRTVHNAYDQLLGCLCAGDSFTRHNVWRFYPSSSFLKWSRLLWLQACPLSRATCQTPSPCQTGRVQLAEKGFVLFYTHLTLWSRSSSKCYLRIQSVPQREHHTSPLQRSTG
jgi:hypothetical protein